MIEWRDQRRREAKEQAYQRLRERYEIILEPAGQAEENIAATSASARSETAQAKP
jgi:hypothetical protein